MIAYLMVEDLRTCHDLDAPEAYHRTLDGEFQNMMH